jgi:acid phosphatase (class A)
MPASKLFLATVVVLGALGVTLTNYVKIPWRDAVAGTAGKSFAKLGYLSPSELPSSTVLLPPPPAPGSAAMKTDEAARAAALPLKGTPRYTLAAFEANRSQQNTIDAFKCAFGTDIGAERTPRLAQLLSRLRLDVRAATYAAKSHFRRPRPWTLDDAHTCYPADEAATRNDGSYPSARGAVGWSYALVLAELRPDRADEILKRGRDFGQSRVICDQEWQSDVDAGRTVATVIVGQLEANARYKADLEAAREEVAAELAARVPPGRNCAPESAVLASRQETVTRR